LAQLADVFDISKGLISKVKRKHLSDRKGGIFKQLYLFGRNISKTIIAKVPMTNGEVQEISDFEFDGVTFPADGVPVEFIVPVDPS